MNSITNILSGFNGTCEDDFTYTVDTSVVPSNGYTLTQGGNFNSVFSFTEPTKSATIKIKGDGGEEAEIDAAFINDLKLLLELINDLPDEHPLGELKHDMRMRRAFKRLGG